jgi:signal transduction histidine kinase
MRERVHQLQGEFTMDSSGSGTKICASLPAKEQQRNRGQFNDAA